MEKKSKKTNNKNMMKTVKIITIVLAIILISLISFFGIYVQNKNNMRNKLKDYIYAMDINGARTIKLELNTATTEVIKDSEGNIIEEATEEEIEANGYVKEQIPNNSEEAKTKENYQLSKKVIEKRLKTLGVENYNISLNETTGEMTIEIPENNNTDNIVSKLNKVGKFEIIDTETQEILMNNEDIKSSDTVLYRTSATGGSVYLEMVFNKKGKEKLEDISEIYVAVEDTEKEENTTVDENEILDENDTIQEEAITENETATEETATEETTKTEKTITMKLDDEEIMTTSFSEPLTTGVIQLTVGAETADSSMLQDYMEQSQEVSIVLDSGNLPLQYDIVRNQYILSDISEQDLMCIAIVIAVVAIIGIVYLIVKYRTNGALAGISYIGLAAIYLLLIREVNVLISIESIFGIIIILILNYIYTNMLLQNIENDKNVNKVTLETYTKFFSRIIPICIMVVAFCFMKWVPISSFGMMAFWGLVVIAIYNAIITRNLLKIKVEGK